MNIIRRFFTWFSDTFRKRGVLGKVVLVSITLLVLCCLCSVPIAILNPSSSTPQAVSSLKEKEDATPILVKTEKPVETATIAPTYTPTVPPAGESRDNPILAGETINIGGDMTLTILAAIRPADSIVSAGNMFNTEPEANQEYVQVEIQVSCNKSSNETCYFAGSEIKAVGTDGNIRDAESFIAGVEGLIESGEFFGGATRTGKMFFIVPKDDTRVILFYDPLLFGNTIYFALP